MLLLAVQVFDDVPEKARSVRMAAVGGWREREREAEIHQPDAAIVFHAVDT